MEVQVESVMIGAALNARRPRAYGVSSTPGTALALWHFLALASAVVGLPLSADAQPVLNWVPFPPLPPPHDQRVSVVSTVDFNRDGIIDVELLHVIDKYSAPQVGAYATDDWETLCLRLPGSTGVLGTVSADGTTSALAVMAPDAALSTEPGPGQRWLTSANALNLEVYHTPPTTNVGFWSGPMSGLTNAFFGIKFEAADGWHLGWARVVNQIAPCGIVDWGFQPAAGEGLRVGEKPAAPEPDPTESTQHVPVDMLGSRSIDFAVHRRYWTNAVTGETGLSAWMTGHESSMLLAAPGQGEGTIGLAPAALGPQIAFASPDLLASGWLSVTNPVALVDLIRDPATGSETTTGALANRERSYLVVRVMVEGGPRFGWLLLDSRAAVLTAGLPGGAFVTGEPSAKSGRSVVSRTNIDIDDDGLVDCVVRGEYGETFAANGDRSRDTATVVWVPEANAALSAPFGDYFLVRGERVGPEASPGRSWQPGGGCEWWGERSYATRDWLAGWWGVPYGVLAHDTNEGFIGLQFQASDGRHSAWMRLTKDTVLDYGYNPVPGGDVVTGQNPSPAFIDAARIRLARDGAKLRLSWAPNPLGRASRLLVSPSLGANAPWSQTGTTTATNSVVLPGRGGPQLFFRLE